MKIETGQAVAVYTKDAGEVMRRLIGLRINDFNLYDAGDFRLVVFRRDSDCERFCTVDGLTVTEEGVRYQRGWNARKI